jgi:hypothetical protein
MDRDRTDEAKAKRGANPAGTRNVGKKLDKARKPLGLIDHERPIKAIRFLQEHPKRKKARARNQSAQSRGYSSSLVAFAHAGTFNRIAS